ncbi:hypothetical protein [Nocardioides euryhalodurans]|uniref:hypothetical protein n=1 Tax=Nocardioides euryhalodurans TaxID=2518370 RepID=UPI001ABEB624|nr:hypothetical protein [Nocardioides euryhalodurans]
MNEAATRGPEATTRPPDRHWWDWWHDSHPTFAALTGFFAGMVFVTAVPGGFAGVLRLLLPYDRAEELFPLVLVFFLAPLVMLFPRRTRRFAQFMWLGMAVTAVVVLGVASLVLYFMVRYDS